MPRQREDRRTAHGMATQSMAADDREIGKDRDRMTANNMSTDDPRQGQG